MSDLLEERKDNVTELDVQSSIDEAAKKSIGLVKKSTEPVIETKRNRGIHSNIWSFGKTGYMPDVYMPAIVTPDQVDPRAKVIGLARIKEGAKLSKKDAIRVDEGYPMHIGTGCIVGKRVVLHGLKVNHETGENLIKVNGKYYSVFIRGGCELGDAAQVHGPACLERRVFINDKREVDYQPTKLGYNTFVFKSIIIGCILGPGSAVIGTDLEDRYVLPGKVVKSKEDIEKYTVPIQEYYKNKEMYNNEAAQKEKEYREFEKRFQKRVLTGREEIQMKWPSFVDETAVIDGTLKGGQHVHVSLFTRLHGNIEIDDITNIQDHSTIVVENGKANIGKMNSFAHQAKVKCGDGNYGPDEVVFSTGDNCFIGMKAALIAKKLRIGNNCTIGACSGMDFDAEIFIPDGVHIPVGYWIRNEKDLAEVIEMNKKADEIEKLAKETNKSLDELAIEKAMKDFIGERSAYRHLAHEVPEVNSEMVEAYEELHKDSSREVQWVGRDAE